jgi:hypothetical protein
MSNLSSSQFVHHMLDMPFDPVSELHTLKDDSYPPMLLLSTGMRQQ